MRLGKMGRWGACVGVLVTAVVAGCGTPSFHCLDASDCKDGGAMGTCEPNGFCSFPDDYCPSGRRYGEHAGAGLANACVDPETAGNDTDGDDDDDDEMGAMDEAPVTDDGGDTTGRPIDPGTTTDPTTGPPLDGTGDGPDTTGPFAESGEDTSDDSTSQIQVLSFGERNDADVQGVTEDTFMTFWELGHNNGTHTDQHIASIGGDTPVEVSLTRFELTALQDVTVVSVELILSSYDVISDGTINLYRLNESWDEGVADMEPGICNWQLRQEDVPWLSAGAQGQSHNPEVVGSFALDDVFSDFSIDIAPDLVQDWIDDPSSNHGILFMSTDVPDAIWWASSEELQESMRPLLVVRYLE